MPERRPEEEPVGQLLELCWLSEGDQHPVLLPGTVAGEPTVVLWVHPDLEKRNPEIDS